MDTSAPHRRFKEAREQAGLSIDEVAIDTGANVFDLEEYEGDLTRCYSPIEVKQLCEKIGIRTVELFGDRILEPAVSAEDLVEMMNAECKSRSITLEQFEDAVGWKLSDSMQSPGRLLEEISIEGLQWLCRELKIDWKRVLLSLDD